MNAPLCITCGALFAVLHASFAGDVVKAGAGSYATRLPEGSKAPPTQIYRTSNVKGPMPTNDWWSSLAWKPFGDVMYPHPLAVRALATGLRVYYPGANLTANQSAIFGSMPGDTDDFVIGHSAVEKFEAPRVDGFSDWFVNVQFAAGAKSLIATFGHGSPFVYVDLVGGDPTLTFAAAPKVWSGSANDAVLGVSVGNRHYGIFAPTGSTWSDLSARKWTSQTYERGYFSVAVLPDASLETLALFRSFAYQRVTGTGVSWHYDEKNAEVGAAFTIHTTAWEGPSAEGTLFALYPHQWTHTGAKLLGKSYDSVRGPMKLAAGSSFSTAMKFPGVLPSLPLAAGVDKPMHDRFLAAELKDQGKLVADTYWLGKQLGKWATLIPIAEQTGNQAAAADLTARVKASLENFFTAIDSSGALKKRDAGLFYYDANWGTLIGYPAAYGSDEELNDHHFHYGYFVRAAAELARRDPAWAAKWGDMVRLLIRDIAGADRGDQMFPFLRSFDPYAGHTWASGHAKFADGNNNESSSEAVNAWSGLILWGEATGDKALRDLGVWLFTTEVEAIDHYWFDVTGQFHHKDYPASVVTMIWGGKGGNGTWFSGNPELVHGINWLPFTGGSLYLGRYPDYCAKNYAALVSENKADDEKKAGKDGGKTVPGDGRNWDQWADIVWMYRALSDPQDALAQFIARKPDFRPEGGNSLANAFLWITALDNFGQVDRAVTADAPLYAVFTKGGKRTHVAYNAGGQTRTVTFSDGVILICAPHEFIVKR